MTKVTNIPSRLHSVEQGNIVAGANEIYDDTKGKKQNVINSETDAELLRLEQTKQDNLTFDNAPTENSNNPVKSGGVYAADLALQQAIEAILLLIPSAATSLNQLADKAFVNSSISTATATFRGTYNVVTDLHLAVDATHAQIEAALASVVATADNNDYCYVQIPVSSSSQDIQKTSRYKFNGTAWVFEYDLNTSGFTSAQWAAINSGITAALVTKLGDLPYASELSADLSALSTAIGSEETRAKGVEQGLSTAVQGILDLIPSAATSSNKLTDKAYVDGLIQTISALIPAEATDQNQLADKAYVLAQILAATPAFKGQFTTFADLEAVSSPKAGDIGIVRTTDSDGFAVFTFYQYLNNQWNVYYTLAHHLQNKPATTGTTGDYPYNGMGRVVLPMNIKEIGGVTANYLEQSMMPTATGGNTIYVITHDYVLASDITIPANCVLEFEGGSITASGNNDTITGDNTCIQAGLDKIFDTSIILDGTWKNYEIRGEWFGVNTSNADNLSYINRAVFNTPVNHCLKIGGGDYVISNTVTIAKAIDIIIDGSIVIAEDVLAPAIILDSFNNKRIRIHIIRSVGHILDYTENNGYNYSIGIVVKDCKFLNIDIDEISLFSTGIYLYGGDIGTLYNRISIRRFYICFNGIKITNVTNVGVNGNKFFDSCFAYLGWNQQQIIDTGFFPYFVVSNSFAESGTPYYNNSNSFENFTIEYNPSNPNEYNNPKIFKGDYVRGYTFDIDRIEVSSYSGDAYDAFTLSSTVFWSYFNIKFAWGAIAPLSTPDVCLNRIIRHVGNVTSGNPQMIEANYTLNENLTYKGGHVFVDTINRVIYINLMLYWSAAIAANTELITGLPIPKERAHNFIAHRTGTKNFWTDPAIVETVSVLYNQVGSITNNVELAANSTLLLNIVFPY